MGWLCAFMTSQGKSPNLSMSLPTHYDDTTTQNQGREDHKESHNNSKVETGMWRFVLCRSYSCAVVCRLSTPAANKSVQCSCEFHSLSYSRSSRQLPKWYEVRLFSELLIYTRFEFHSLSYSRSSWRLPKWYEVRLLWASDLYKVLINVSADFKHQKGRSHSKGEEG